MEIAGAVSSALNVSMLLQVNSGFISPHVWVADPLTVLFFAVVPPEDAAGQGVGQQRGEDAVHEGVDSPVAYSSTHAGTHGRPLQGRLPLRFNENASMLVLHGHEM